MLLVSVLIGCDDPTDVGRSLVDAQAGESSVATLAASSIELNSRGDITGGNAASGAVRVLSGVVQDPVAGEIQSTGYMDFVPASQFESSFLNGSVSFAEVELSIDYVYGDTSGSVVFELVDIAADWESSFARADTSISTGNVVLTTSIPARTGIHSIGLPQTWVSANDALLRSSSVVDDFHGFALRPVSGNAVLGIRFTNSRIRASATPGDTVSFGLSKIVSGTDEQGPIQDSNVILLRDGSRNGLDVVFPFEGDEFPEAMIHRVLMRFNVSDFADSYPEHFNRPDILLVGLRAVSEDGATRLDIAEVIINSDGSFTFDNTSLTNVVQTANLGKSVLGRFELYFPVEESGVGFIAIQTDSDTEGSYPRALVTHTPIN